MGQILPKCMNRKNLAWYTIIRWVWQHEGTCNLSFHNQMGVAAVGKCNLSFRNKMGVAAVGKCNLSFRNKMGVAAVGKCNLSFCN